MDRRRANAAVALVALVAASCTGSGPRAGHASRSSTPSSTTPAMVLDVRAAGYGLPVPIERAVAVDVSGTVYIAGGLDPSGTTASGVFRLDSVTGELTQAGNLRQAVHDAAAANIDGKLCVFGGGSSVGTDLVQTFDPATGGATVTGHLPVALSDLAAATVGNTTYLVGGYDGSRPRSEIYATTNGRTLSMVARLSVGLRYPAVTAVGNTIVIAGESWILNPSVR